jgi:hypothetical protein
MRARLKSTNTKFKEGETFFREIGFLPLVTFMVNGFYEFAEELRTEAENAIKSELSRRSFLERAGFRMFMPLTVNVITDQGAASLTIFKDGTIQLGRHLSSSPDNTIKADFETLIGLYHSRDRDQFVQAETEGKIKITSRSWKGQQAERKLRELLGY